MNWISLRLFVICRKQPIITALFTFMLFTSKVYIFILFKYNSFNSTSPSFQHLQSIHSKTCDTLSVTETPFINTFLWAPCGIDIFTSKLATNNLCTWRHHAPRGACMRLDVHEASVSYLRAPIRQAVVLTRVPRAPTGRHKIKNKDIRGTRRCSNIWL